MFIPNTQSAPRGGYFCLTSSTSISSPGMAPPCQTSWLLWCYFRFDPTPGLTPTTKATCRPAEEVKEGRDTLLSPSPHPKTGLPSLTLLPLLWKHPFPDPHLSLNSSHPSPA